MYRETYQINLHRTRNLKKGALKIMGKIMYKNQEFQGKIERLNYIIEITLDDYEELSESEVESNCYYISDYDISYAAVSYYGVIFIPETQGGE